MKRITVSRKRKMASGLMPYWLITGISKEVFVQRFCITKDISEHDSWGSPVGQITDDLPDSVRILDSMGTRISNGETVTLEVSDDTRTIFASTCDGSLSNEIQLGEDSECSLTLTTKGGWTTTVSYPQFIVEK